MATEELQIEQLIQQLVYALMLPPLRLARIFNLPLKQLSLWLKLGYFHELRRSGLTLEQVCERLEISLRTAARLNKKLRLELLRPDREHELPRQIEFVLWAEPLSELKIQQALPLASTEEIGEALETLIDEGRVIRQGGRTVTYATASTSDRLVRRGWLARIGGLRSLLTTVTNAVYQRFFEADEPAFARNLSFRIRAQDLPQLNALYEEAIWERLKALDEAARDDPDSVPVSLAFAWASYELLAGKS